jgi:tRNA A-37 threonylcarbamoyl transferase component Bud32
VTAVALAPDAALPQRDVLLDPDLVARLLERLLVRGGRARIDRCERTRAKYRVGESLRVLHRLEVDGRGHDVAARAFTDGRGESAYRAAAETAAPAAGLRPVAYEPELDAVFWTFPNDRKLSDLAALVGCAARELAPQWARSVVVAYAPEKAATARWIDGAGATIGFAKAYAGLEGVATQRVHERLGRALGTRDALLGLPRPLAYSERRRTLLLEPVAGRRLDDLQASDRLEGTRVLGRAAAALHRLPVGGLSRFRRLEAAGLERAAATIGRARPDVARAAAELADALVRHPGHAAGDVVCLHGDLHAKNAVLRDGRVTLIDLDQAAAGPAAADLGGFLAGLRYDRCIGALDHADERALARALLAGYAEVAEPPAPEVLRAATAAALLAERALRAVNRVRPLGLRRLSELLADGQRLLAGAAT